MSARTNLADSPPVNLVSTLLRHAELRPDAPAIVDGDLTLSFCELEALAAQTAGSFERLGVAPGDRVAIAAANDASFVGAYLGALWSGAVAVPLNPTAPIAAHAVEIERVGARVVVCGTGCENLLELPGAIASAAWPKAAPGITRRISRGQPRA